MKPPLNQFSTIVVRPRAGRRTEIEIPRQIIGSCYALQVYNASASGIIWMSKGKNVRKNQGVPLPPGGSYYGPGVSFKRLYVFASRTKMKVAVIFFGGSRT